MADGGDSGLNFKVDARGYGRLDRPSWAMNVSRARSRRLAAVRRHAPLSRAARTTPWLELTPSTATYRYAASSTEQSSPPAVRATVQSTLTAPTTGSHSTHRRAVRRCPRRDVLDISSICMDFSRGSAAPCLRRRLRRPARASALVRPRTAAPAPCRARRGTTQACRRRP